MKTFKTTARLLALLLVLTFVLLPLVGCVLEKQTEQTTTVEQKNNNIEQPADEEKTGEQAESSKRICTVVLETEPKTVYTIDLDKVEKTDRGLISVLEYLKATEQGFDFEETSGWLSKVGALEQDNSAGKYVYLWTSVEADQSATPFNGLKEYNGVQMIESGKGADKMTIQSGAIYYIALITYSA